jgi:DNA-binding NarL/FixJ family response regulator
MYHCPDPSLIFNWNIPSSAGVATVVTTRLSEARLAVHETSARSLTAFDTGRAEASSSYPPKPKISVLLVDTQALFRSGLAKLLSEDDRLFVAAISDGGEDVAALCAAMSIDVVVTDIQLRESDGIDLTRLISRVSPATRVLILASSVDWRVIPAMTSGAAGFLLKDTEPDAIRAAVVSAHLGGQVLCREAAHWLIQDSPDHRLTRRESDILQLVAQGAANKEIADLLQLGDKTVRNYVSRLYRKLAIQDRAQLTSLTSRADSTTGYRTEDWRRAACDALNQEDEP